MLVKKELKKLAIFFKLYKLNALQERFYVIPYHMVTNKHYCFFPSISKQLFESQIKHLKKYYHVISLEEIIGRVLKSQSIKRCAAITFDDGFADNYYNAYPILKRNNLPATVFLTTGFIETGEIPWFIKFRYMFMKTKKTFLQVVIKEPKSFIMKTDQQRFKASKEIMQYLRKTPDKERVFWIDWLSEALEVKDFSELKGLMLNWEQIREMSQNGFSFGSHTVNHPVLTQISFEQAEGEILQSKKLIEKELNKKVMTFAYPFGKNEHYSKEIKTVLIKSGFQCAVSTESGANDKHTDLLELKRDLPWELRYSKN